MMHDRRDLCPSPAAELLQMSVPPRRIVAEPKPAHGRPAQDVLDPARECDEAVSGVVYQIGSSDLDDERRIDRGNGQDH